jgi:PAS domain S-box-containing protein
MPERSFRAGLAVLTLRVLFATSLVPMAFSFQRKVADFGRPDVLVERIAVGYEVRKVGPSAASSGLQRGDEIVLIDGREAREVLDPTRLLAKGAELRVLRGGLPLKLVVPPCPSPWDVRYLFLAVVGLAFLVAGARAIAEEASRVPFAQRTFAALSLGLALTLVLTPAPPYDGLFHLSNLAEDVARAFFPALLLHLTFTFPRRARHLIAPLLYLPALLLLALTLIAYLVPGSSDAAPTIGRLDVLQALWIGAAVVVSGLRLALLARRRIDLLAEKQTRYLLYGTVLGLLPVCLLSLLPGVIGKPIPILGPASLLPLALVPAAFLAALLKFRLWDVEVLGREAAAVLGALVVGAGCFTAAQLLLAHPIATEIPYAHGTLQTAAGLLLALTFVPVRRGLSATIARLQLGDTWREREHLLSLVRTLPLLRRFSEIESVLTGALRRGLGVTRAVVLPCDASGVLDATHLDGGPPLLLSEIPEEALRRTVRLSRTSFESRPTGAVLRLREAGCRTLAPLAVSGRLLALCALGDRGGRIPLSSEDLDLAATVLAPAALALDHARLDDELRTQAERYRALKEFHEDVVSGSAAAIAATDAAGRLTSAHPAFARLVGLPAEALLGRPVRDLLPAAITGKDPAHRAEVELGGAAHVLDVSVSPFPGAAAGSAARVYVLHDATETARLERALASQERLAALGTLSAGVAHEVNTPLTGVAGFARLLLEETPEGDPRRDLVQKIEKQAFRASRLVGSLLDLARGRPRELALLDPGEVAREAARSLEDEIAARRIHFTTEIGGTRTRVRGHADALVQVLVNLLKNGMEAAAAVPRPVGSHGNLRLALREQQGKVLWEVEDDGPGMGPEQAARAFEPFFSTKTAQGGAGLGLAIAGDIIRAHGGTLTVDSAPGEGCRFTVAIPAAA